MKKYLEQTSLLDYHSPCIQQLITQRGWQMLDEKSKILSVYNYVRDEMGFGYNVDDNIPASRILADGIGQCNTKGTLFMALLRAVNIPCRIHGFTIYKTLQKGAMTGIGYLLAPKQIMHSWVEVYFDNKWYNLEGFILDKKYLNQLQKKFSAKEGGFCGYGASTDNFKNPQIDWDGNDTYIQKEGIARDLGVYNNPDELWAEHHQALCPVKAFIFRHVFRHIFNRNVDKIRQSRY